MVRWSRWPGRHWRGGRDGNRRRGWLRWWYVKRAGRRGAQGWGRARARGIGCWRCDGDECHRHTELTGDRVEEGKGESDRWLRFLTMRVSPGVASSCSCVPSKQLRGCVRERGKGGRWSAASSCVVAKLLDRWEHCSSSETLASSLSFPEFCKTTWKTVLTKLVPWSVVYNIVLSFNIKRSWDFEIGSSKEG
jgi:hypothetical protein